MGLSDQSPEMTRRSFVGGGLAATGAVLAAKELLPRMLEAQQGGVEALSDEALYEAVFGEAQELLDQYSAQLVE